jgi:hypothetical protein
LEAFLQSAACSRASQPFRARCAPRKTAILIHVRGVEVGEQPVDRIVASGNSQKA